VEMTLNVIADPTPPALNSVTVLDLADLLVRFNEPVPAAPTFTVNNGITVIDVAVSGNPNDSSAWKVHTGILTPGTTYTLTVTGATDFANNTAGTLTKTFTPALLQGHARWEAFMNIPGGSVFDLTGNAKFPDRADERAYRNQFEAPVDYADNFGTKLSGYFQAPSNGDYVFFLSADDGAALYLSTDEDPANKKQIAAEATWSGNRSWVGPAASLPEGAPAPGNPDANFPEKRSDTFSASEWPTPNVITLVGGRRYYIEALSKEGGGGDNLAATWKLAADPDPQNGSPSLTGARLSVVADPVINITAPTTGSSVTAGTATTITSDILASAGVARVEYFANGTKIGESTTAPYSFTMPAQSVVVGRYSITARVTDMVGGTFTSQPVIVTVRPSGAAKKILFLHANGGPNASDITMINRLFSRGYDVYSMAANTSTTASATGMDLVLVSSTVGSGDVAAKFLNSTIGVVSAEGAIQDDMQWTLNVDGTDRGTTTGATSTTVTLSAAGAAHPIGAGLTAGDIVLTGSGQDYAWGLPASSATLIASIQGQAAQHAVYALDTGAVLINGSAAAGRRVMLPFTDNVFNALTANGLRLFDQAIDWASGGGTTRPRLTISKTATDFTITWTGGGTLHSSATADGVFTTTGDSDGTYTEAIPTGAAAKFFTVKIAAP